MLKESDIPLIKKHALTMFRNDIAILFGVSSATLQRFARKHNIKFTYYDLGYRYSDQTIEKVLDYYKTHSRSETQKKFKNTRVRSIIDQYKDDHLIVKQKRWTHTQKLESLKIAGLVGVQDQINYFSRPNAGTKSIQKLYKREFKSKPIYINGLPQYKAKYFVDTNKCPYVQTNYWMPGHRVYLWVDMEKYLKPSCPDVFKTFILSMSNFQKWIHQNEHPTKFLKRAKRKAHRVNI